MQRLKASPMRWKSNVRVSKWYFLGYCGSENINDKEKTKELLSGISDNVSKQQDILTIVYDKVPEASKEAGLKSNRDQHPRTGESDKRNCRNSGRYFSDQEDEAPKLQKEMEKITAVQDQEKDKEKKEIEVAPKPEKRYKSNYCSKSN